MKHLVFIYGTLKKGFPNHDTYMESATRLGKYQTLEKYPLVLIGERHVPCMINTPGQGHRIEGELYEVDDDCLKKMDALEGTKQPDGYRRLLIPVRTVEESDAVPQKVHAYLMPPGIAKDFRSQNLSSYSAQAAKKYRPQ
jgi:gamma-glutamylaminecyclotransferase